MANGKLTVQDIITRVQRIFGDEAAVQVSEADIIRWINDACREAVMQHENLLQKEDNVDSVVGQSSYNNPVDCFTINGIFYRDSDDVDASYYALRFIATPQLDQLADGWRGDDYGTGTPQVYTRGPTEGQFSIFPAPDNVRVDGIKLIYARYSVDIASVSDEIDLPAYYHSYVEAFCMMKAYEMDEDWESADRKAQYVQSTLDFNNNREGWFGRKTYPSITVDWSDYD